MSAARADNSPTTHMPHEPAANQEKLSMPTPKQRDTEHSAPADLYICPSSGETESLNHGGFDTCCDHPRCPGNTAVGERPSRTFRPTTKRKP